MKKIPLTQGKYAVIDDEDYDWLAKWKWHAHQYCGRWYALRTVYLGGGRKHRENRIIRMHREILNTPQGMETDHANGNGLDNRRSNLRICTRSQNAANRKVNKSGYKGVHLHKQTGKWHPRIKVNYESISLGLFENQKDAARAYDKAARHYFGQFARTNF